jgi:protein TonB
MAVGRAEAPRFGASFALALALHGAIVAGAIVASRRTPPPPLPPVYRVSIVAAPPGERRIGQVRPAPPTPEPEPVAPAPPAAEPPPQAMPAPEPPAPAPRRRQPPATPNPTASRPKPANTPVPRAGGGPTGDRGTDVATVRTEGIDFPYPSYLSNIVRQIALRFKPEAGSARTAEVLFLVHRDGSVTGLRFVRRSGDYAFDLEAQGAVEAAAAANAFGSLPQGFPDDVLPIFFSFDPRVIR